MTKHNLNQSEAVKSVPHHDALPLTSSLSHDALLKEPDGASKSALREWMDRTRSKSATLELMERQKSKSSDDLNGSRRTRRNNRRRRLSFFSQATPVRNVFDPLTLLSGNQL